MSEASVNLTTVVPPGNVGVLFQLHGFTFRQDVPQLVDGEGLRVGIQEYVEIDFPSAALAVTLTVSSPGSFAVISRPKGIQLFEGKNDGHPLRLDFGPMISETGIVMEVFEHDLYLREVTVTFGDDADCG